MEQNRRPAKPLTEWRVVMWLTFFGLAAANAWRLGGARFDPDAVVLLLLLVMAINFAAAFASLLGSRTAFYVGFAGSILGTLLFSAQLVDEIDYPRDRALVREIVWGGIGLSVGGLAGIGLGYAWDRTTRRKP